MKDYESYWDRRTCFGSRWGRWCPASYKVENSYGVRNVPCTLEEVMSFFSKRNAASIFTLGERHLILTESGTLLEVRRRE